MQDEKFGFDVKQYHRYQTVLGQQFTSQPSTVAPAPQPQLRQNNFTNDQALRGNLRKHLNHKSVFVQGPISIIQLYRRRDNKLVTFMADIHRTINECGDELKNLKNVKVENWTEWIEEQIHTATLTSQLDIFFEDPLHHFFSDSDSNTFGQQNVFSPLRATKQEYYDYKEPIQYEQGRLFGQVIPFFRQCLLKDKVSCAEKYKNTRFHYVDARLTQKFPLIFITMEAIQFIDINQPWAYNQDTLVRLGKISNQDWNTLLNPELNPVIQKQFTKLARVQLLHPIYKALLGKAFRNEPKLWYFPNIQTAIREYPFAKTTTIPTVQKLYSDIQVQVKALTQLFVKRELLQRALPPINAQEEIEKALAEITINNALASRHNQLLYLSRFVLIYSAVIMDVYTVARLLKPYIQNAIIVEGYFHVQNQIEVLQMLGFDIIYESSPKAAQFNTSNTSIKDLDFTRVKDYSLATIEDPVSKRRDEYIFYTVDVDHNSDVGDNANTAKVVHYQLLNVKYNQCQRAPESTTASAKYSSLKEYKQNGSAAIEATEYYQDLMCPSLTENGLKCSSTNATFTPENTNRFKQLDNTIVDCTDFCNRLVNRLKRQSEWPVYVLVYDTKTNTQFINPILFLQFQFIDLKDGTNVEPIAIPLMSLESQVAFYKQVRNLLSDNKKYTFTGISIELAPTAQFPFLNNDQYRDFKIMQLLNSSANPIASYSPIKTILQKLNIEDPFRYMIVKQIAKN